MTRDVEPDRRSSDVGKRIAVRCARGEVEKIVRLFLGQYPQATVGDADIYIRQLIALLLRYPAEVVRLLADGASNPVPASDYLPSVVQVRKAIDTARNRLFDQHRTEKLVGRLLAARKEHCERPTLAEREADLADWERVKATMGAPKQPGRSGRGR